MENSVYLNSVETFTNGVFKVSYNIKKVPTKYGLDRYELIKLTMDKNGNITKQQSFGQYHLVSE